MPPPIIEGLDEWERPTDVKVDKSVAYLGWDEKQKAYFVISGYYIAEALRDKKYAEIMESSWVTKLP